ncbi:hypothetical protein [Duganella callida]|uniref:Aspartyl protease n=1 Tax=Duganella callida TaxID=2561932 RepID=A0A4Y9S472_9BURK|nr:hypothetical protein [Duganella callida]TFW14759.1 hypothetical protein E4L98_27485 [Duganella callida]
MRLALPLLLMMGVSVQAQEEPGWRSFHWEYAQIAPGRSPEKAGLFLPAQFDGRPCTVQLDTGMNQAFLWHGQSGEPGQPVRLDVAGVVKQVQGDRAHLDRIRAGDCSGIASVGNAFFEHGSLVLDLPHARYRFEAAALLADQSRAQPLTYARWFGEGGHLLVNLTLPSGAAGQALLDTGAASFSISPLTTAAWAQLVELPLAAGPQVSEYKVSSWGRQISCFETTRPGPLTVGASRRLDSFRVSYCQLPGFSIPQQIVGLLGLHDLMDSVITLDYRSSRWMIEDKNQPN